MTDKQKQYLLGYLGYYDGEVDGIFGSASKHATKAFQSDYGLDADGIFGPETEEKILDAVAGTAQPVEPEKPEEPAEPENFWDGIKHFDREEFRCKCGGKYCNGFPVEPSKKLLRLADRVREHFGDSAIVSSGIRCETHNAKVGGVAGSRHKYGTAMDFRIEGKTAQPVLAYVQAQPETNYAYDIDGTYIHMDVIE